MDATARIFLREAGLDKCVFCRSEVLQGKVLGCLHLACRSCALSNVSFGNTITCTRCQVEVRNPGHGYNVVDSLADLPGDGEGITGIIRQAGTRDHSSEQLEHGLLKRPKKMARPTMGKSPTESSVASLRVLICESEDCKGSDVAASSKCMECSMTLCKGHALVHSRSKTTSTHCVLPLNEDGAVNDIKCRLHSADDLTKYCSTCETLVCEKCLARNEHATHVVEDIRTASDRLKGEYGHKIAKLASDEDDGDVFFQKENDARLQMARIADQHYALSAQISDDFQIFRHELEKREASLKNDLDRRHWVTSKRLDKFTDGAREQRGQLMISHRLVSCLDDVNLLRASKPIRIAIKQAIVNAKKPVPACSFDTEYRGFSSIAGSLGRLTARNVTYHNIYCLQFDSRRMMDRINLSSNSQLAANTVELECIHRDHLGICGAGDYSSGVVHFRVELHGNAPNNYVGVTQRESPLPYEHEKRFLGWGGHTNLVNGTAGGRLGLDWRNGDVVRLTLNCIQKNLTALHERTGDTETIHARDPALCFKVLLGPGGSARILPRIL